MTTPAPDPAVCDDYELYEGSCYKYYATGMSWDEAQAQCVADGGGLVEINDVDEQNFVAGCI